MPVIGGTGFNVTDQFDTRNFFYGWQFGARAEYRLGELFFVDLVGKLAFGDTHEDLNISGSTLITPAHGSAVALPGGILALPTNMGSFSSDRFSVVPQIGINLGCQLTDHIRASVGYTFLYWSDVIRPGQQIDRGVNLTQLPTTQGPGTLIGPPRPAIRFDQTDFWAQGINVGLEVRF